MDLMDTFEEEFDIFDLELHETTKIKFGQIYIKVMKVPNGFLYIGTHDKWAVFVPYKENKKIKTKRKTKLDNFYEEWK